MEVIMRQMSAFSEVMRPSYSRDSFSNAFARHGNLASWVAFPVAGLPFLARELSMLVLFLP